MLGMPTEKEMCVLDTDESVVAISRILYQEQEWNVRTVLRPIAYGSKSLSDTEMKYGAPKAEMFAVFTFVEEYKAYLGNEPFKLRVDNRALSWLKTYSLDQSYIGRWIVRLDGYNMIIQHRTRDKHQNADSLSKKTEFYERQEQREADMPEIKDRFSFMDKPIEDHPDLPTEHQGKSILERSSRMPMEIMLKSKIVKESLKAKGYNLDEAETGKGTVGHDLRRLLETLADEKPVVSNSGNEGPEVTIKKREETHDGNLTRGMEAEKKKVIRSLVEKIPEDILRRTTLRRKRVSFKEDVEHFGQDQESEECQPPERDGEEENLSGESRGWDEGSEKSDGEQDSLCMILVEAKRRYHDRELQTDPSSGTYNLEYHGVNGGEEREMIAVTRKPFRELSCNSNIRTNLEPESRRLGKRTMATTT